MGTQKFVTNRRGMLKLGLGASAAAALTATGCSRFGGGGGSGSGSSNTINFVWWGEAKRAEVTEKALELFKKENEGVTVKTEYQDSGPYKDKLATRFAAGDAPDLFAQRRDSLREYADRDALLNLAEHTDKLNLSAVPENIQAIGKVGDKLYGIPAGLNSVGFVINTTLTDQYGIEIPDGDQWSWDDYFKMCSELTKASGGKVWGGDIDFGTLQSMVVFIRQTGEDLYNEDGSLGVSEATMTSWYEMSVEQRKSGALPPGKAIETAGSSADQSLLAKGTVASQIIPTNNMLAYNEAAGGKLKLLRIPGEVQGKRRGMTVDPSMHWSIGTKSKNIDGGLKLLDFLINSEEGNLIIGPTRGVPVNPKIAEAMLPTLGADDKVSVEYLIGLTKETLPISRPDPVGGSEVASVAATLATEVMFERVAPAAAAKDFVAKANKALGK